MPRVDVFIVEFDPNQNMTQPTVVQVGVDSGYSGGPVNMTFIINSTGVQITAGARNSVSSPSART